MDVGSERSMEVAKRRSPIKQESTVKKSPNSGIPVK